MKKSQILVVPFMSLAFLFSCQKPTTDDGVVSKDQYIAAIKCTDIKYMQMRSTRNVGYGVSTISIAEVSPTVSHSIDETGGVFYYESYVNKDGNKYSGVGRMSKTGSFGNLTAAEAKELFKQPVDLIKAVILSGTEIDYDKLTYHKDTSDYTCEYQYTPAGQEAPTPIDISATLKFSNKKLVSVVQKYESTGDDFSSTTFTYEEKTPKLP